MGTLTNGSETDRASRTEVAATEYSVTRRASLLTTMSLSLKINHNAFSVITRESAYWAGFLAADGNMGLSKSGSKRIRIYLKKSDSAHLEKFKRFLQSEHKVSISPTYDRCSFEFSSEKIYDDLEKLYKLTPRKSLTLEYPDLPFKFQADFIRGLFDGDGCLCETFTCKNSKLSSMILTIVGTESVVDGVTDFATKVLGPIKYKPATHTNGLNKIFNLATVKSGQFCDILYHETTDECRLTRKYEIYHRVYVMDIRKTRELIPYDQRVKTKTSRRRTVVKKEDGIVQTLPKVRDVSAYMALLQQESPPPLA